MNKNAGNKIEILAPVGNREMLTAAVFSGADAVYLGYSGFNARSSADNFTAADLKDAVAFCHARGVKVHVALNITVYNSELPLLRQAVLEVAAAGADAVILQDLATMRLCKQLAPGLSRHASTQMTAHTLAGVKKLAEMGFERVVLARELSMAEIAAIVKESPIETEVFIHGALCMSVSGQCYLSAFLGGRSGNRGSCAGPCRLPFDARTLPAGVPGRDCHLSLKDNSGLKWLAELQKLGVSSAKIEGRLRTPEYVAGAVNACRSAREGLAYDEEILRAVFSRSGFTGGYLDGKIDGSMFGVRTAADAKETKEKTPQLRELFRREHPGVPVRFTLEVSDFGQKLTAEDGDGNRAFVYGDYEVQPARTDPTESLKRSLSKTGGTPFFAEEIDVQQEDGPWFLPGSAVNDLRRQVLEQLLKKRSEPKPILTEEYVLPQVLPRVRPHPHPLNIRVADWSQLPATYLNSIQQVILPIEKSAQVPAQLRDRVILELPRVMFGGVEQRVARQIEATGPQGFAGYLCHNIAHFGLAKGYPCFGGFGLNVTNSLAAQEYADMGLKSICILPEVQDREMELIAPERNGQPVPTEVIIYGHLPLMVTRACPLQNVRSCAACPAKGELTDRKARKFRVECDHVVRTIYNPVPLYLGEKPNALPVENHLAWFTAEDTDRVAQVLDMILKAQPYDGEFTRGLYFKGTSGKDA